MTGPLLLVGCGKMGGALLRGWLERGVAVADVVVVEPGADNAAETAALGVTVVADAAAVDPSFAPAVVVLAVKPQVMDEVIPPYARHAGQACYLSIAAGRTIASFEAHFGADAAIVRAMPNTPAAVGRGATVLCPNAAVNDGQRDACADLLRAVGEVDWITDEGLMDAVTAVSGSGPAYVFLMIEALAAAGVDAGLPEDLAVRLARATVAGAGELARQSEENAGQLRVNVTSPGGTTAAALDVLMGEAGLPDLMRKAVRAAADRSRELAG
jgi:pyrroline-5-carboxylate reductase